MSMRERHTLPLERLECDFGSGASSRTDRHRHDQAGQVPDAGVARRGRGARENGSLRARRLDRGRRRRRAARGRLGAPPECIPSRDLFSRFSCFSQYISVKSSPIRRHESVSEESTGHAWNTTLELSRSSLVSRDSSKTAPQNSIRDQARDGEGLPDLRVTLAAQAEILDLRSNAYSGALLLKSRGKGGGGCLVWKKKKTWKKKSRPRARSDLGSATRAPESFGARIDN